MKPANLGSSVGISKVHDRSELAAAMDLAARFDRKLVIEQGVGGPGAKPRELEVSVLGNDAARGLGRRRDRSRRGVLRLRRQVPLRRVRADHPREALEVRREQVRAMAIAAFRACDCAGLARVDFLMEPKREDAAGKKTPSRIFLNEINTMPGFTSISMYPKLWEASGLPYKRLIDRLIALALERQQEKTQTRFTKE